MSHDDRAGKQSDNPWKTKQLSNEICDIASEKDQAGLFDRISIECFIDFEEIAQSEARNCADRDTEKHENQELYDHVHDCIESS